MEYEVLPVSYKNRTTAVAVTEWLLFLEAVTVAPLSPVKKG